MQEISVLREAYGHQSSFFRTSQCKKLEKYENIRQNLIEGWTYSRSKWETVKQRTNKRKKMIKQKMVY